MADAQTPKVTFGSALARSVLLARRLRKAWGGQKMVGLLLPPSVPGALANFAALLMGKVPVNLNYTLSAETLGSCVRQCEIKTVLSSKAFLDKVKLTVPCETILLEELLGRGEASSPDSAAARPSPPTLAEKMIAFLMARFLPAGWLERALGCEKPIQLDDLATIIFSSGSTGEPKGVMLSHYNIGSNVEQLEQVFGLGRTDRILGILPFFHSFAQ